MLKRKQKTVYAFQDGKKGNVAKTQDNDAVYNSVFSSYMRTLFLFIVRDAKIFLFHLLKMSSAFFGIK